MTIEGATPGYFDIGFYERIQRIVQSWKVLDLLDGELDPDEETRRACERLVYQEARLIDQGRLDEWLDLYTEQSAYWLPADVLLRDPAVTVSWEFNDRRRMEERVDRLMTGKAYSQMPPTRSTHSYTNVEQVQVADDEVHLLCNFMVNTSRPEGARLLSGWNGFILKRIEDQWMIELKRVNLLDADGPQGNLSFFL